MYNHTLNVQPYSKHVQPYSKHVQPYSTCTTTRQTDPTNTRRKWVIDSRSDVKLHNHSLLQTHVYRYTLLTKS